MKTLFTILFTISAFAMQTKVFDAPTLEKMAARFAPTNITVDISSLPASERTALSKLVEAAKVTDGIFLRQVWAGNDALLLDLVRDQSPLGRARLHYFLINKGPWSDLDMNQPFIANVPAKPESGNFYPPGTTRAEIEEWIKTLPEPDRARATGFFTTIRRGANGFTIVPYSVEYQGELALAGQLLREAAAATTPPTPKTSK